MRIELLVFGGCPLAKEMRVNLTEAVDTCGWPHFEETDLAELDEDDPRRRYASPTVLADSKDIMGLPPHGEPMGLKCRVYPEGVPTSDFLVDRLFARYAEIMDKLNDFR